ncbi:alpha/beta fold hydrolase [Candidatus Pelagibacter sp. Uisw_134_02]|uniref:alpha/beta fold hydrolase n=1 Tax=Candidatus Pelagibacter sp. Uisw_134_02 TaxID=3230990 RepID=UPI0039ED1F41
MINGTDSSGTFYLLNKTDKKYPIVFIHGVGLTHEIWKPQLDYFKDSTTISFDILGHGKTSLNKSNISFDDFSEQLVDLLRELKFDKIHLVGFSIGSLIARNFATKYNERLKSLTLLGSIFKRSEEQQKIVNDRFNLSKKNLKLSKQALKRWFTDKYLEKNPDTYEKISSILEKNNMESFLKVYKLFVFHKNNEAFQNIKVNTLVMTGENDVGSTIDMSKKLSKVIINSQLKVIKGGKHLCSIECADDVNIAIKNFIELND